jgi:hypothetical protein
MLRSRPLFLIVITLCLLVVVVASYWVALLPQRTLNALKNEMLNSQGLVLEAKTARLDVGSGFGVVLDDVSISSPAVFSWSIAAKSMVMPGFTGGSYVVDRPVIDVDATRLNLKGLSLPETLLLRDGILKLRDPERQAVLAITDINGKVTTVGGKAVKGQLAMVWDAQVSDLSFEIEDIERFGTEGSPMDVTLKNNSMLFGFSGQGRADAGLQSIGRATAGAEDVGQFARWIGLPLKVLEGAGPMTLQSAVGTRGLSLNLSDFTGIFDEKRIEGELTLEAGADRSKLSGDLKVAAVSLLGAQSQASLLAQPWSETPLALDDVAAIDLDLKLSTEKLMLRQRDFGAVSVQFKSNDDALAITLADQPLAGGRGSVALSFLRVGSKDIKAVFDLTSVSAQTVLGGVLDFAAIDGSVDLKADVTTKGASLAAWVSALAGTAKVKSPNLTVLGVDMVPLLVKPQTGWQVAPEKRTTAVVQNFELSLTEGVATVAAADMTFAGVGLKPRGEIDLLRQVLALQLSPKGKNADAKMSVSGPWVTPVFSTANPLTEKTAVSPPAN